MSKNDDFIDKANQNGINVPYSCKNGMCATCRCKVSSVKQNEKELLFGRMGNKKRICVVVPIRTNRQRNIS